jgi:hypothetical protein
MATATVDGGWRVVRCGAARESESGGVVCDARK